MTAMPSPKYLGETAKKALVTFCASGVWDDVLFFGGA